MDELKPLGEPIMILSPLESYPASAEFKLSDECKRALEAIDDNRRNALRLIGAILCGGRDG